MSDEEKIAEFSEMVQAVEKAARELAFPWKVACAVLSVALMTVLLHRR